MVWAYDFVFDTTASGQQIKCLTVVDEYTRECLAIDVAGAIRSMGEQFRRRGLKLYPFPRLFPQIRRISAVCRGCSWSKNSSSTEEKCCLRRFVGECGATKWPARRGSNPRQPA